MEHVSCCEPFSQHLSAVQEYVAPRQFSLHQKYQAVRLDPHRRLLVDHQLKLLEPHFSRFQRCRRLLRPRHFPKSTSQTRQNADPVAEKQHWFSVAQRDFRHRRQWLGCEGNCKVFNDRARVLTSALTLCFSQCCSRLLIRTSSLQMHSDHKHAVCVLTRGKRKRGGVDTLLSCKFCTLGCRRFHTLLTVVRKSYLLTDTI